MANFLDTTLCQKLLLLSREHYKDLEAIWRIAQKSFLKVNTPPEYTFHGEEHCIEVASNLDRLIPNNTKETLNEEEIFVLLCAVIFHDYGMTQNREKHNVISGDYIKNNYQNIYGINASQAEVIGFLCLAHRDYKEGSNTISTLNKIPNIFVIQRNKIRVQFLASLLRLADELDTTFSRAPEDIMGIIHLSKKAQEEWVTHNLISGINIEPTLWKIALQPNYLLIQRGDITEGIRLFCIRIKKIQGELDKVRNILENNDIGYSKVEVIGDIDCSRFLRGERKEVLGPEVRDLFTEKLINALERLAVLEDIDSLITAPRHLLTRSISTLKAVAGIMMVKKPEKDSWEIVCSEGFDQDLVFNPTAFATDEIHASIIKEKKTSVQTNLSKHPIYSQNSIRLESFLGVPLESRGEVLGFITFYKGGEEQEFVIQDKKWVSLLASLISIRIDEMKLISQVTILRTTYGPELDIDEYLGKPVLPSKIDKHKSTILFADMRNYTSLLEVLSGYDVRKMLDDFYSAVIEIVNKYDGRMLQFRGDGGLVLYGHPKFSPSESEGAMEAVDSAIVMQLRFRKLLTEWRKNWDYNRFVEIGLGIGINTGDVALQRISLHQRDECTPIGDAVNVASRLCDMAKVGEIMISNTTCRRLGKQIEVKELKPMTLKHKSGTYRIYEIQY